MKRSYGWHGFGYCLAIVSTFGGFSTLPTAKKCLRPRPATTTKNHIAITLAKIIVNLMINKFRPNKTGLF